MLNGTVNYETRGIMSNVKALQMSTELMAITNENIVGFDKIGYQKKIPVVSAFAEYLGPQAISSVVDDSVGRLVWSENPLDVALAEKGYFQIMTNEGTKLSRDGRLKVTKDGEVLTIEGNPILTDAGTPLVLPFVPENLEDISIDLNGTVKVLNQKTRKFETAGTLSVVTQDGAIVMNPNVRQGYNESSNVSLQSEFMQAVPYMRLFQANAQLYRIQNSNLQKAISYLAN